MKAISRRLDRFCYDHPNFGIPNLMMYIAIGTTIVSMLTMPLVLALAMQIL